VAEPIVLIGPMGAGKSTIGRLLAAKLGLDFVDTDHEIEQRTGADIPWIFDVEGEAGFREREHNVLVDMLGRKDIVLATGGGIVVRDENRKCLQAVSSVIFLVASLDQLAERTFKDKKRPLLQVADPRAKLQSILEEREPLYTAVADLVLHTDGMVPKQVVNKIVEQLGLA